jgi:hypothetical protein
MRVLAGALLEASALVAVAPSARAANACGSDARGESQHVAGVAVPYDAALDITDVGLRVVRADLEVQVHVADLAANAPAAADGMLLDGTVTLAGTEHTVHAQRDRAGLESFRADGNAVAGRFDAAKDEIVVHVSRGALWPNATGVVVASAAVRTARSYAEHTVAAYEDSASTCAAPLDLGELGSPAAVVDALTGGYTATVRAS